MWVPGYDTIASLVHWVASWFRRTEEDEEERAKSSFRESSTSKGSSKDRIDEQEPENVVDSENNVDLYDGDEFEVDEFVFTDDAQFHPW
ncbi:MAG: hypothetical protein MHM6MM_004557 [Cercozoa sp. M6MM]